MQCHVLDGANRLCAQLACSNAGAMCLLCCSVTNYFLVNLSFADLLVTLICMPMAVGQNVTKLWIYGEVMCMLTTYFQGEYAERRPDSLPAPCSPRGPERTRRMRTGFGEGRGSIRFMEQVPTPPRPGRCAATCCRLPCSFAWPSLAQPRAGGRACRLASLPDADLRQGLRLPVPDVSLCQARSGKWGPGPKRLPAVAPTRPAQPWPPRHSRPSRADRAQMIGDRPRRG